MFFGPDPLVRGTDLHPDPGDSKPYRSGSTTLRDILYMSPDRTHLLSDRTHPLPGHGKIKIRLSTF